MIRIRKQLETHPKEYWIVDMEGNCGKWFDNVAQVIEPLSANPGITLHNTTGLCGLKKLLTRIEKERRALGLKPATNKP